MDSTQAFLSALDDNAGPDELAHCLMQVRHQGVAAELARACADRIARGTPVRADASVLALFEELALATPSSDAYWAAREGHGLASRAGDHVRERRFVALALRAAQFDDAMLSQATLMAGGVEDALATLGDAVKWEPVKKDAVLVAGMRRALQRVLERDGQVDAAFFEAMKAARKVPSDGLYIDDVFRLAVSAKRDTEASIFFQSLVEDGSLSDKVRASLLNKLGAVRERLGEKSTALTAYRAALLLRETKGTRRNAERLARELGVEVGVDDSQKSRVGATATLSGEPRTVSAEEVSLSEELFVDTASGLTPSAGRTMPAPDAPLHAADVFATVPPMPFRDDELPPYLQRAATDTHDVASISIELSQERAPFGGLSPSGGTELPVATPVPVVDVPADTAHTVLHTDPFADEDFSSLPSAAVLMPPSDALVNAPQLTRETSLPLSSSELSSPEHVFDESLMSHARAASSPVDRAVAAMSSDDPLECAAAASALDAYSPGDPRVLRLAARALLFQAGRGELDANMVELFALRAEKHGERAVALALDVLRALPEAARAAHSGMWLASARAAGNDMRAATELLRHVAIADAPNGPAFSTLLARTKALPLDQSATAEVAALDLLGVVARAIEQAEHAHPVDPLRLQGLHVAHARVLAMFGRHDASLTAYEAILQYGAGDAAAWLEARSAFANAVQLHGVAVERRIKFLQGLKRLIVPNKREDILTELLDVALQTNDANLAESTALELLRAAPSNLVAVNTLIARYQDDPARSEDLVVLLNAAAHENARRADRVQEARRLFDVLAVTHARALNYSGAADARAEQARLLPDAENVEAAVVAFVQAERVKDAVFFLEELSNDVADNSWRAQMLVRAATLANGRLQKKGRARELLERAVEIDPRSREAEEQLFALLHSIGDAQAAEQMVVRRLGAEADPRERARLLVTRGRLQEEHYVNRALARQYYQAACADDPRCVSAWQALARLAADESDTRLEADARLALAAMLEAPEERARAYREVSYLLRDIGDETGAEAALASAVAANPGDIDAVVAMLELHAARVAPNTDTAELLQTPTPAFLERIAPLFFELEAHEDKLPCRIVRLFGDVRAHQGDIEGARLSFEQALTKDPRDLTTLWRLARLLAEMGPATETRRARVLENLLLHHGNRLALPDQIELWSELCVVRVHGGDMAFAQRAAKKALGLATTKGLHGAFRDAALWAMVDALDVDVGREPQLLLTALRLRAESLTNKSQQAAVLLRAARVANELGEPALSRNLLAEACALDPASKAAIDAQVDLQVLKAGGAARALAALDDALLRAQGGESVDLHRTKLRLLEREGAARDVFAAALTAAARAFPADAVILDAGERFYTQAHDDAALDVFLSDALRAIPRDHKRDRSQLCWRLFHLRRKDSHNLQRALETLETIAALDVDNVKAREESARILTDMGLYKEALSSWRSVLERDVLGPEAWRAIFALTVRLGLADEAFAVANTLAALHLCDEHVQARVVAVRASMPKLPKLQTELRQMRQRVGHPWERAPMRQVLLRAGPRLLPAYVSGLKDLGYAARQAVPSVEQPLWLRAALERATTLCGLRDVPLLFVADANHAKAFDAGFSLLPTREPAVVVSPRALQEAPSPERVFALGRACAWLSPEALLAAALDVSALTRLMDILVCAFLGPDALGEPDAEIVRVAPNVRAMILKGQPQAEALRGELSEALRDHVQAQRSIADWRAGVSYTADRFGFLMHGDLDAAVRVVKKSADTVRASKNAVREMILFSVSAPYFSVRRDLGLQLPPNTATVFLTEALATIADGQGSSHQDES